MMRAMLPQNLKVRLTRCRGVGDIRDYASGINRAPTTPTGHVRAKLQASHEALRSALVY